MKRTRVDSDRLTVFVRAGFVVALALAAAPLTAAHAGPPFVTDDPEPTDYRHFEIYLYFQGTSAGDAKAGTALALEVNYGALPDVQISVALPAGFSAPARATTTFGVSDAEIGIKYRFIAEDARGWRPQVSFYPAVQTTLGSSCKSLGDTATHVFSRYGRRKASGPGPRLGAGDTASIRASKGEILGSRAGP
jgi:hypothetical protein